MDTFSNKILHSQNRIIEKLSFDPLILVWPVPLAQVLPCFQLIFPSKSWYLEFIWIFSSRNYLNINISHILNPNLTKQTPLNPAHQDLSNNSQGTFQFLRNFQLQLNLIFKWRNHSRTSTLQVQMPWNQADAPLLLESFPKRRRTWSEASQFGGSHKYKTKQTNYIPS